MNNRFVRLRTVHCYCIHHTYGLHGTAVLGQIMALTALIELQLPVMTTVYTALRNTLDVHLPHVSDRWHDGTFSGNCNQRVF